MGDHGSGAEQTLPYSKQLVPTNVSDPDSRNSYMYVVKLYVLVATQVLVVPNAWKKYHIFRRILLESLNLHGRFSARAPRAAW